MKKVMISMPMAGKSENQIKEELNSITEMLNKQGYDVIDSFVDEDPISIGKKGVVNVPLYFLSKSLECLSHCDALYCGKGWETARGCRIERETAKEYGLKIIEE